MLRSLFLCGGDTLPLMPVKGRADYVHQAGMARLPIQQLSGTRCIGD